MKIEVDEVEQDDEKIIDALLTGDFASILGEDMKQFMKFIKNSIDLYGGFLVTIPLAEGGLAWFFYKYVFSTTDNYSFNAPVIYMPTDPIDSKKPEDYKNYPVWHLGKRRGVA